MRVSSSFSKQASSLVAATISNLCFYSIHHNNNEIHIKCSVNPSWSCAEARWKQYLPLTHFCWIDVFILIGGSLLYNIVMVLATHQHELVTGIHVPPPPSWVPSHVSPHPIPLGCPEHQLWVLCFMHGTCTDHLFYIWWCTCFNAILWKHPTLVFQIRHTDG